MSTESQKRRIQNYLEQGNTITTIEAFSLFGITKLTTRISELIHDDGIPVKKEWKVADSGARFMQYSI